MIRSFPPSKRPFFAFAALAVPVIVAGCVPIVHNRGNMLDEDRIAQVKPGVSSKNDVFEALGSPSAKSTFDDNTWYYVGIRTETEGVYLPVVTDRKVIEVSFDDTDHVRTVDRIGPEQITNVIPLSDTTPAAGRDLTFMEQLFGNVGRAANRKKAQDEARRNQ